MNRARPTVLNSSRYYPAVYALAVAGGVFARFDYRLFALASKCVGLCVPSGVRCQVELLADTRFCFELRDFYWNRLIASAFNYEPEILLVLDLFKDIPYGFVDCGANYGFWSLIASSHPFGAHRVIAIEALTSTFRWLERNVTLNARDIKTVRAAVTERPNERKIIYERGRHAGASLDEAWLGNDRPLSQTEPVETVSLDALLENNPEFAQRPRIIKLDIEGEEVNALAGGRTALSQDAMVIYEEYGEEIECKTTKFILDSFSLRVFFVDDRKRVLNIQTIDQVRMIKTHRTRGYNFVAVTPNSIFDERLSHLAEKRAE